MGKMGQGKLGNLSQIITFFSDFPPISYEFHTFFLRFPLSTFGHFAPFPPIFSHFPPFPPISPISPLFSISPIFFTSAASWLMRLRLTPMPVTHGAHIYWFQYMFLDKSDVKVGITVLL